MRLFLIVLVALAGLAAGLMYYRYGTLEPCRALAQDMADKTFGEVQAALGSEPGETPESAVRAMRLVTSQYDTSTCASKLWARWTGGEES